MTLSKLYKMSILFGIIAMFFAFTPAVTMAGGGPEPGGGCGEGYKYMAPPYIGDVTITFNSDNSLNIFGQVEQLGNTGCTGVISAQGVYSVTLSDFQNLKPANIRQTCLVADGELDISISCGDVFYYYEVVGVGNLKYDATGNQFTAQFVIMGLR